LRGLDSRTAKRGVVPDLLTDQTSAHDPIGGYVPNGMTLDAALELRKKNPEEYKKRSMAANGAARFRACWICRSSAR